MATAELMIDVHPLIYAVHLILFGDVLLPYFEAHYTDNQIIKMVTSFYSIFHFYIFKSNINSIGVLLHSNSIQIQPFNLRHKRQRKSSTQ